MGVAPNIQTITIATGGTAVRVQTSSQYVVAIYFEATTTNGSTCFVGDSTVTATKYVAALAASAGFGVTMNTYGKTGSKGGGPEIQMNAWYVNGSNAGDSVQVTFFERVGSA